jgi:dTDP-4-amino-4,6-dideoxygalactose transaminase
MIRLSKCFISEAEKNIVAKVFSEEHFGMGSYVDVFEKKLKNFFGREVVTVINGTSALLLGLQALGVKRGDEVLVQSMTYLSSFQAISALGAKPIPCDINEDFTISLEDAQKKKFRKKLRQ